MFSASTEVVNAASDTYVQLVSANGVSHWLDARALKVFIDKQTALALSHVSDLEQSLRDWDEQAGDLVGFTFVDQPGKADIVCSWTEDARQLNNGQEAGHAVTSFNMTGISGAKILLLSKANGKLISDAEMRRTCLHEIGHALGLDGHSDLPSDVMYTSGLDKSQANPLPSSRDISTLKALYALESGPPTKVAGNASGSPLDRCIQLNNEGTKAALSGNQLLAIKKYEEALVLQPGNETAQKNMCISYNILAAGSAKTGNLGEAESFFKKALACQSQNPNAAALKMTLENYAKILRALKRSSEAEQMEARAKAL